MRTAIVHGRARRGAAAYGFDCIGSSGGPGLHSRSQVPVRGHRARRRAMFLRACSRTSVELSVGCSSILSKAAWTAQECARGHPALLSPSHSTATSPTA